MIDFTKSKPVVEVPNLLEIQKTSFETFLQKDVSLKKRKEEGLQRIFKDVFPIQSHNGKLVLDFVEYRFGEPRYPVEKCKGEGLTYSLPLYVKLRLKKKETGEVEEQEIYLLDFPLMTREGIFIINGAERVVVSQLQRSPGVFFEEDISTPSGRRIFYRVRVIPERGNWLDFEIRDNLSFIRINSGRRFLATLFMRAMGGEGTEILKKFTNPEDKKVLEESFKEDGVNSEEEALLEIYQRIRPGRPLILKPAKEVFDKTFKDSRQYNLGKVGRSQLNKELELNTDCEIGVLQLNDIIEVMKYLLRLTREKKEIKSLDHLSYGRVRRIGDLLSEQLRMAFTHLARVIQQGMSSQDPDTITPRSLINTRTVRTAVNSFFSTGELSQYLDQTNPLAELTHKRRLSSLGPGGLTRVQAKEEVRDVHYTHYGRICPIGTPEKDRISV